MAEKKILKLKDYLNIWNKEQSPLKVIKVLQKLFMQTKVISYKNFGSLNIKEEELIKIIKQQNKIWMKFSRIKKLDPEAFRKYCIALVPEFKNKI